MATLDFFPGLFGRKLEYLRGLGEATLDGRLDPVHLRSLPFDDALRELHLLSGIGDFSARLILLRSTGRDGLPAPERRLLRALELFTE